MDYIKNFEYNSTLGNYLYWLPLIVCVVGFTLRTHRNYLKDRKQREIPGSYYYVYTDTVGTILIRTVVSILPIANMFAATFNVAPELVEKFSDWLDKVFDIPLVPDSESYKAIRETKK